MTVMYVGSATLADEDWYTIMATLRRIPRGPRGFATAPYKFKLHRRVKHYTTVTQTEIASSLNQQQHRMRRQQLIHNWVHLSEPNYVGVFRNTFSELLKTD